MFIGHFAVALAAKKVAPKANLGVLTLAAQWADTLWPALLLTGTEKVRIDPGNTPVTPLDFVSYPISHSLVALAGWGLIFGSLVFAITKNLVNALIVAALVLSHWVLDWITHRPDMPINVSDGQKVGLGLWYSLPATAVVELAMLAIGLWLYVSTTRARDKVGKWGFWSLVAILGFIFVVNLFAPPPPSVAAIAYSGLIGAAVFFVWAWWADAHRELRS